MAMQDNLVFQKVKNAYAKYLEEEAKEMGNLTNDDYWTIVKTFNTPEEMIDYILDDLHTDAEDFLMELYYIMASIISLNGKE